MSDYDVFAKYYDKLMYDVNYEDICGYILSLAEKHGVKSPALAVDLGCGTGKTCLNFSKKGFDMIGVDISEDMLAVAKENALAENAEILYLNQDMTDFELYGTVALATCLTDGINHITDSRKLKRMFYWVHNYLDYEGVFIFDINSKEKISEKLGNNIFYEINDDVSYIWQSKYDRRSRTARFDLTFFIKEPNGLYSRRDVFIKEKAYSKEELKAWLSEVGFSKIKMYERNGRIYFVCVKPTSKSKL